MKSKPITCSFSLFGVVRSISGFKMPFFNILSVDPLWRKTSLNGCRTASHATSAVFFSSTGTSPVCPLNTCVPACRL